MIEQTLRANPGTGPYSPAIVPPSGRTSTGEGQLSWHTQIQPSHSHPPGARIIGRGFHRGL